MEICFPDEQRQTLFCCQSNLVRKFGPEIAKLICCRLATLAAAPVLADLPAKSPIRLAEADGSSAFSVALGHSHLLIFRATKPGQSKSIDRFVVTEIEITEVIAVPAPKENK